MWPSSFVSKSLLTCLFFILMFFIYMDVQLYLRIQTYPIERSFHGKIVPNIDNIAYFNESNITPEQLLNYSDVSWLGCKISPLCDVTVKALLLDHINHYLFSPLASIFDMVTGISENHLWITPNMISVSHVFIAALSGKCVANDNLMSRRLGVLLFQVRTWMDDLDGHVARERKHVKGERSEVGTSGYWVDGVCDGLGCIALLIGLFVYLKNNPPRRGYMQLKTIITTDAKTDCESVTYKQGKCAIRKVARLVLCFGAQLLFSSMLWNRYIAVYQDMLERDDVTNLQFVHQNVVFKSSLFFVGAWLWRIVNVHNMIHILLFAIFCDKLWEFICAVQYMGFVILICVICVSEMHVLEVQNFIFDNPLGS